MNVFTVSALFSRYLYIIRIAHVILEFNARSDASEIQHCPPKLLVELRQKWQMSSNTFNHKFPSITLLQTVTNKANSHKQINTPMCFFLLLVDISGIRFFSVHFNLFFLCQLQINISSLRFWFDLNNTFSEGFVKTGFFVFNHNKQQRI